jgi:tocopherol O-methyltransferase
LDKTAITTYYSETSFEYKLLWNWMLKGTPALHFGYYDEKATKHEQAIERANEVLADLAGIGAGANVIDAGCGLGQSTEWLATHRNANVTGITITPAQVSEIKKRHEKKPVANVDFMVADYLHMPFEDNSVDFVWAIESVCHAVNKGDFYKEAFRVLKPGGKVAIGENARVSRPMSADKEALLQEIFSAWAIPDLDTVEEHTHHAAVAGFKDFTNVDITKNVMQSYINLRKTCKRYYKLSSFLYKTGIISRVRHNNMLGSLKQADAIEQDVFTYHHFVATKPIV